ncbi:hypothetical protein PIB30_060829 [Stylosanthes scabra]|uniref:Uncharacterized protein n=1 Tax=Stylosanthes scabra TaxID=79078 RepID=A0ABU6SKN5_9FABA|nr:hypothetical protein [Stylosanthes scabra]
MLHKFASQMVVNPQPSQPSSSTELPSHPLPNPKGVSTDKEDEFSIATVYGGIQAIPEELPEKCVDPRPCFVTCKIGKKEMPECLCDPGACASVMPLELRTAPSDKGGYKQWGISSKYFNQLIHPYPSQGAFIMSSYAIKEARRKMLQRKSDRKRLKKRKTMIKRKKGSKITPPTLKNQKKESIKVVKKKKPDQCKKERNTELKCADFKDLIGKLKMINNAFVKEGDIGELT